MVPVGRVRACPSPFFSLAVAGMNDASRIRSCGAAAPPLRPVWFFWCGGRADAPPSRRAIESPASRPPDGRARLRARLAGVAWLASRAAAPGLNRGEGGGGASSCRWKSLLLFGGDPVSAAPVVAVSRRSWPTADGRCRVRRPLSRPTADVPARRAPSPPGAGGTGVFRPLRRAGKDGKDSVKGNRQGSLSRLITRRSDQNRKIKYCLLFCDFAGSLVKSPKGCLPSCPESCALRVLFVSPRPVYPRTPAASEVPARSPAASPAPSSVVACRHRQTKQSVYRRCCDM